MSKLYLGPVQPLQSEGMLGLVLLSFGPGAHLLDVEVRSFIEVANNHGFVAPQLLCALLLPCMPPEDEASILLAFGVVFLFFGAKVPYIKGGIAVLYLCYELASPLIEVEN